MGHLQLKRTRRVCKRILILLQRHQPCVLVMVVQNLMIQRLELCLACLLVPLLLKCLTPVLMLLAPLSPMIAEPVPHGPSLLLLHESFTGLAL